MDTTRLRVRLEEEFGRLRRAAAVADLEAAVPSCPEWRVRDLLGHVGEVYLHKTESMRRGDFPKPWPPDLSGEEPLDLLDWAFRELIGEFDARPPEQAAAHWFPPDATVGGLVRRMAQETAIHRVDAELAAGTGVSTVADDLALDGIDEMLVAFLAFQSGKWPEAFKDLPATGTGPVVAVVVGDRGWSLAPTANGATVTSGAPPAAAAVTVSGDPHPVLLWLWGRVPDSAVSVSGDPGAMPGVRGLLREAAQ